MNKKLFFIGMLVMHSMLFGGNTPSNKYDGYEDCKEEIEKFLAMNLPVNTFNTNTWSSSDHNKTILHYVAEECKDPKVIDYFIEQGAKVNCAKPMYLGDTLSPAPASGAELAIGLAFWGGVKIQQLFPGSIFTDDTPLHTAAKAGNYKAVARLIEHGADVNAYNMQPGVMCYYTPLMCAAQCTEPKTIALLLDKGATLDPGCLDIAIKSGRVDNVKQFVTYDAKLLHQTRYKEPLFLFASQETMKESPLQEACNWMYGHNCNYFKVIRCLLEQGVDLFAKGGYYGSYPRDLLLFAKQNNSNRYKAAIDRSLFYLDTFIDDLHKFADNPKDFKASLLMEDGTPYPKELFLRQLYYGAVEQKEQYYKKLINLFCIYSKNNELAELGRLLQKSRLSDCSTQNRLNSFKETNLPITKLELNQLYGIKQINFYFE